MNAWISSVLLYLLTNVTNSSRFQISISKMPSCRNMIRGITELRDFEADFENDWRISGWVKSTFGLSGKYIDLFDHSAVSHCDVSSWSSEAASFRAMEFFWLGLILILEASTCSRLTMFKSSVLWHTGQQLISSDRKDVPCRRWRFTHFFTFLA